MEEDKTYDNATKGALENFGKLSEPEVEVKKEVIKEVKEPTEEVKVPEVKAEVKKEEKVIPKAEEEISPERLLKELNKLGFKVKGKEKTILSNEELKRLINLGFNYSELAHKLNEERQALKQPEPKKEEVFIDYDEKQKQTEERVKAVEEFVSTIASQEIEKELDEAVVSLKESFPSITEEELDVINLELQNRLDLIPKNKKVDIKNLMHSIYLEFNPDAFNKKMQTDVDKKVQEGIDEYKKSLSKKVITEGGSSAGSKSVPKSPLTWDESVKKMEEELDIK